jgi:hypothetical protein
MRLPRRLPHVAAVALSLTIAVPPVTAQSVFDTNVRAAPQYVQYQIKSPVNETIAEFTVPVFVVIPVSPTLNIDVGTAYAWARVQPNSGGSSETSTINGLTDTQVRANLTLGTDFVVLTAGLNLPTGRETASNEEQLAAFRIGNDFLAFPISNMGTGFGGTGGIAVARPLGVWNLGFGGSVRLSSSYAPFEDNSGTRPRFQPGNEYRARLGADRPFGTGRFAIGVTFSKFGDDDIGGSIYNTGNRYIAQMGFTNSLGAVNLLVNAWNLYRGSGTIFTGERIGPENITNLLIGIGVRSIGGVIEPSVELRNWQQETLSSSMLGTIGLRYSADARGVAITPSVGYTTGRFATSTSTAKMTGFRGALAMRFGP